MYIEKYEKLIFFEEIIFRKKYINNLNDYNNSLYRSFKLLLSFLLKYKEIKIFQYYLDYFLEKYPSYLLFKIAVADAYSETKNYKKTQQIVDELLLINNIDNDKYLISEIYFCLANNFSFQKKYLETLEILYRIKELNLISNNSFSTSNYLNAIYNIAKIKYEYLKKLDESFNELKEGIDYIAKNKISPVSTFVNEINELFVEVKNEFNKNI